VTVTACGAAHSTATSAPQAISSARKGPAAHLLAAGNLPVVAGDWASVDTDNRDLAAVGPCYLTSLTDIGATAAARRTWSAEDATVTGVQVVARFADNKSAWRAHEVLSAWHDKCAARVSGDLGPLRKVAVPRGVGQGFRVTDDEVAVDIGILRRGAYVSVVAISAPAAHFPADARPARTAVKRVAATF